jgi:UDP-N-acetyl-D-galactosamine dehydrogenase
LENLRECKIAVIGLGYVGLPLAVAFAGKYKVTGFDINKERISALQKGMDSTLEVTSKELEKATFLTYTYREEDLAAADIYIVTVPTPVDAYKKPDLTPLRAASQTVGKYLKKGNIVIYESTVYPGCTEEVCVPELEKASGLVFNEDFYCGYSPERINPGDKVHRIHTIVKVTSGSTPEVATLVDDLYKSIIEAGTHKAPSIKVAEASKIIENVQRDVNISFVNELALIFDRMGIDTTEVLEAAGTKWNFLPFRPGLVGGHCIGVDPYYLTYKAESLGYYPEVILSGRRINDTMGVYVANRVIKRMLKHGQKVKGANALVLGITFKENCPDIRNTRVVDVVEELKQFDMKVDVYDPYASKEEVKREYGIDLLEAIEGKYELIILTVSHTEFKEIEISSIKSNKNSVVFDIKSFLPKELVTDRL